MQPGNQLNSVIMAQADHGNWGVTHVTQSLTHSQKVNNTPTQADTHEELP